MQKIFLKKKKKSNSRYFKVFIVFLFLIFIIIFSPKTKNFFYKLFQPIQFQLGIAGESISNITAPIIQKKELRQENEKLKEEKKELIAEISNLKTIFDENKILREALDMGMAEDFKVVLADVTGKDIKEESILIDKGKNDGLYIGIPIVTQKRIIVGKIIEVYDNYSRVMMITHKESVFDAEVQGRELVGTLKGNNSGIFLDLIPKEEEVQVGDAVITASLSGVFPANLFVGTIKNVEVKGAQPFKSIEVQPFFKAKRLKQVFAIIEK